MIAAQRVEGLTTAPLLQTYCSCIGIVTVDSYLYVFYPNTIRVYEHFPLKLMPELLEELIVSQRKIVRFAVSSQYIAMLFQDSKLEVRLREHWERVIFSFNIPQQATEIDTLELIEDTILYRYFQQRQKSFIYGFVKLSHRPKEAQAQAETMFWSTSNNFDHMVNLKELGNIENFYFGLLDNQIHFGTFFKIDGTQILSEFQFGKVKEENKANKVLSFSLFNIENSDKKEDKERVKSVYLVKLIEQSLPDVQKLIIKYYVFYKDLYDQQKPELDSQEKRIEFYSKIMDALLQLNGEDKEKENNGEMKEGSKDDNKKKKSIQISLGKEEKYSHCVHHKDSLYFATNLRVFRFSISQKGGQGDLQQVYSLQKGTKFIGVCQEKLYLAIPNLYVASSSQNQRQSERKAITMAKQNKIKTKSQQIQTEVLSDVLLDQMQNEQKQLSKMIDVLFDKKQVSDVETQTQEIYQIHEKEKEIQIQLQVKPQKDQQTKRTFNSISVGESLPICPDSHERSLQQINHNLFQIQKSFHKETVQKMHEMVKKEQDKAKNEINKKIQQLVGTAISNSVVPLIEVQIRQIFQAKLQEVNVYLYTLAMENLLHLKQEIQKDEAKENMLRTELIKKQLHEVSESKKAVSQMVEICKKRQIQKIIFFEEVKKKFVDVEKKVLHLQQKVKALIDGEQVNQAKLFDEIEIIKLMIRNQGEKGQSNRKKSTISQERDIKMLEQKAPSGEQDSEETQEIEPEEQSESSDLTSSLMSSMVQYKAVIVRPQPEMPRPYLPQPPYQGYDYYQPQSYPQPQPQYPYPQPQYYPQHPYQQPPPYRPPYQPYQYYRPPPPREYPLPVQSIQQYSKIREKSPIVVKETRPRKERRKDK